MENLTCPVCHTTVKPEHYFCYNCGKNLRPAPLDTSSSKQILYYIGSFLLPPMGFFWGIKYLKEENDKSKVMGLVMIGLTLFSLVVITISTIGFINMLNQQVSSQLNNFGGF